jgi:hypothetical protein
MSPPSLHRHVGYVTGTVLPIDGGITPGHCHAAVDGRCTPQSNIELMPEKEVLDFKPALRLEQVGDRCSK